MNKVVRTIEISADIDAAVERLAKDTERTPAEVFAAAVEHFIADMDDISIDLERWAEYERTGVSLSLEEVRERLDKLKQRTATPT